jgi:hypothetical protein
MTQGASTTSTASKLAQNITMPMGGYEEFLRSKIKLASLSGFDVPLEQINPALKPHTRDIVQWALRGGRRAVFASFGQTQQVRIDIIHTESEREVAMPSLFDMADVRDGAMVEVA